MLDEHWHMNLLENTQTSLELETENYNWSNIGAWANTWPFYYMKWTFSSHKKKSQRKLLQIRTNGRFSNVAQIIIWKRDKTMWFNVLPAANCLVYIQSTFDTTSDFKVCKMSTFTIAHYTFYTYRFSCSHNTVTDKIRNATTHFYLKLKNFYSMIFLFIFSHRSVFFSFFFLILVLAFCLTAFPLVCGFFSFFPLALKLTSRLYPIFMYISYSRAYTKSIYISYSKCYIQIVFSHLEMDILWAVFQFRIAFSFVCFQIRKTQ